VTRRVMIMIAVASLATACAMTTQGASPAPAKAGAGAAPVAASTKPAAAPSAATPVDYTKIKPLTLVNETPKGGLHNPYNDKQTAIVAQGKHNFQSYGCSGCHGGGGGGGMCPPLINGVWIYGGRDDTLFRLVTLGSIALQQHGYSREAIENVVAPMPPFGGIIKNADDLWKILTYVRSRYDGNAAYKYGNPPGQ